MKIPCDVIKDLLPLYNDGACSSESVKLVDEHLKECESCTNELCRLKEDMPARVLKLEENNIIGTFRRSTIKKIFFAIACVMLFPLLNVLIFATLPHISMVKEFMVSALIMLNTVAIPTLIKRNRKKVITVFSLAVPLIIFILLTFESFIGGYGTPNILLSGVFTLAYFSLSAAFIPAKIKADHESPMMYRKTAIKIGVVETITFILLAALNALVSMSEGSFLSFNVVWSMFHLIVVWSMFHLIFIWAGILIFRFVKNDCYFKPALYTAVGGLYLSCFISSSFSVLNYGGTDYYWFWEVNLLSDDYHRLIANVSLVILIVAIIVSAVLFAMGRWGRKIGVYENDGENISESTNENTAEKAVENINETAAEITADNPTENKE